MDELVNQVSERVGIPHDKAVQAVQVVLGFIKDRLPSPIASQIDSALSGQAGAGLANQAERPLEDLGDMFRQKP